MPDLKGRSLESPMFDFSGTCPDFHPNAIWTVTVSGKIMASVPPGDVQHTLSHQTSFKLCHLPDRDFPRLRCMRVSANVFTDF